MHWSIPQGQGGANLPDFAWQLQKLWGEEGEIERRTAQFCGCHSLTTLGNKLKASSLFIPWFSNLAFCTSLVPGAVHLEEKTCRGMLL